VMSLGYITLAGRSAALEVIPAGRAIRRHSDERGCRLKAASDRP